MGKKAVEQKVYRYGQGGDWKIGKTVRTSFMDGPFVQKWSTVKRPKLPLRLMKTYAYSKIHIAKFQQNRRAKEYKDFRKKCVEQYQQLRILLKMVAFMPSLLSAWVVPSS